MATCIYFNYGLLNTSCLCYFFIISPTVGLILNFPIFAVWIGSRAGTSQPGSRGGCSACGARETPRRTYRKWKRLQNSFNFIWPPYSQPRTRTLIPDRTNLFSFLLEHPIQWVLINVSNELKFWLDFYWLLWWIVTCFQYSNLDSDILYFIRVSHRCCVVLILFLAYATDKVIPNIQSQLMKNWQLYD